MKNFKIKKQIITEDGNKKLLILITQNNKRKQYKNRLLLFNSESATYKYYLNAINKGEKND